MKTNLNIIDPEIREALAIGKMLMRHYYNTTDLRFVTAPYHSGCYFAFDIKNKTVLSCTYMDFMSNSIKGINFQLNKIITNAPHTTI